MVFPPLRYENDFNFRGNEIQYKYLNYDKYESRQFSKTASKTF